MVDQLLNRIDAAIGPYGLIAIAALLTLLLLRLGPVVVARAGVPPVKGKPLMTDREVKFCRLLRHAAAPLHVAPQVAMAAIVTHADWLMRAPYAVRSRFDRKMIDFLLVDDDGKVRLIVELDDRTHDVTKDAARDAITARAGHSTLRVIGVTARDPYLLKAAIDGALGIATAWTPPGFNPANVPRARRGRSAPPNSPRA